MSELKLIIITIALSVSTYVAYNTSNEYGWKGDLASSATAILSITTSIFGTLTLLKVVGLW